jgi:hypothetical protein
MPPQGLVSSLVSRSGSPRKSDDYEPPLTTTSPFLYYLSSSAITHPIYPSDDSDVRPGDQAFLLIPFVLVNTFLIEQNFEVEASRAL